MAARCGVCEQPPESIIDDRPGERLCPYIGRRKINCLTPLSGTTTVAAPERVLAAQTALDMAGTVGTVQMCGVHVPVHIAIGAVVYLAVQMTVHALPCMTEVLEEIPGSEDTLAALRSRALRGKAADSGTQKSLGSQPMRRDASLAAAAITAATETLTAPDWRFRLMTYCSEQTQASDTSRLRRVQLGLPEPVRSFVRDANRRLFDLSNRMDGIQPSKGRNPFSQVWAASTGPAQPWT